MITQSKVRCLVAGIVVCGMQVGVYAANAHPPRTGEALAAQRAPAARINNEEHAPLMGVYCSPPGSVVYLARMIYVPILSALVTAGLIDLHSTKAGIAQYSWAQGVDALIAKVKDLYTEELSVLRTYDATLCLLPTAVLGALGITISYTGTDGSLPVYKEDARALMRMVVHVSEHVDMHREILERAVDSYIAHGGNGSDQIVRPRSIRRALLALHAPEWLCAKFGRFPGQGNGQLGFDGELDEASSTGGSEEDDASTDSHFSFGNAQDGRLGVISVLVRVQTFPNFKRAVLKEPHRLDFSGKSLNAINDLATVLNAVLSPAELAAITELDLSDNMIGELKASCCACLPALKKLDLSNNPIGMLSSEALSGLGALEELCLSNIVNIAIPAGFLRPVPRLQNLYASACGLTNADFLAEVRQLRVCDLSGNRLTALPPAAHLQQLRSLNLMDNAIGTVSVAQLPLNAGGRLLVRSLLLNNNQIESLPGAFFDAIAEVENVVITLQNNPMWGPLHRGLAEVSEQMRNTGFMQLDETARVHGVSIAHMVERAIFSDMQDKVCARLGVDNAMIPEVIVHEMARRRALASIRTGSADTFQWMREHKKAIIFGAIIVGAVAGGGIAFFAKAAATAALKAIGIGAGIGGVVGGLAAAAGCSYASSNRNVYWTVGGTRAYMTTELKMLYCGVYRLVCMLSLLKQYLAATNTCLHWLMRYDEYLGDPDHIRKVMEHLEEQLHLGVQHVFARADDPTTIAMLYELVQADPLTEIRRYAPDDLFVGTTIADVTLLDGATIPLIGPERLSTLRMAIVRFARAALVLRKVLVNRYVGTIDYTGMCKIIAEVASLREALQLVTDDVLAVVIPQATGAEPVHAAWHDELVHFRNVAQDTDVLIRKCMRHRDFVGRITS